jgi:hypothetical protein
MRFQTALRPFVGHEINPTLLQHIQRVLGTTDFKAEVGEDGNVTVTYWPPAPAVFINVTITLEPEPADALPA